MSRCSKRAPFRSPHRYSAREEDSRSRHSDARQTDHRGKTPLATILSKANVMFKVPELHVDEESEKRTNTRVMCGCTENKVACPRINSKAGFEETCARALSFVSRETKIKTQHSPSFPLISDAVLAVRYYSTFARSKRVQMSVHAIDRHSFLNLSVRVYETWQLLFFSNKTIKHKLHSSLLFIRMHQNTDTF